MFFAGGTEGHGVLTKILSRSGKVTVRGAGHLQGPDTLVLDQQIERAGSKMKHRQWRLVQTAPFRFRGPLTDAEGPVTGIVTGNDFHVRYLKGAVAVDQHLVLQPGGSVILNRMTFRMLGIRVARMTETIRRVE